MEPKKSRKARQFSGGFLALPHAVTNSVAFRGLPAIAVKLLIDIGSQYNGRNNGDLSIPWKLMRSRGWKSEETLHKAKRLLLEAGFIAETRKGRRPNLCTLFGVTWLPVNPSPKHDIKPWAFPFGEWSRPRPVIGQSAGVSTPSGEAASFDTATEIEG